MFKVQLVKILSLISINSTYIKNKIELKIASQSWLEYMSSCLILNIEDESIYAFFLIIFFQVKLVGYHNLLGC